MKKPVAFDFDRFSTFFTAYLEWIKITDRRFSLRWFAKNLGLKSHTFILKIADGTKIPTTEMLSKICEMLNLNVDESTYVNLLAGSESARTAHERRFFLEKLGEIKKEVPALLLKMDAFELISHWHSIAIFELTTLPSFDSNPDWIVAQLSGQVSKEEVVETLARLVKLGLLERLPGGNFKRIVDSFTTPHNVPNTAMRNFHREMLAQAEKKLDGLPAEYRFFFGHALPISTENLLEAQNLLVEFRQKFHAIMTKVENQDAVYYLAMQFFPLTKVE